MIKLISRKIKFTIERFLIRGARYQLLFIAMLIGFISLIAGIILHYSVQDTKSIGEAVWWAFLRMSDPGYLGDDRGFTKRFISTIVTVLGYVIFLGSLVAILTQWLNSTIRKLEAGMTPVSLRGHFLILGWTSRTSTIIHQLITSEDRINIFLKLLSKSKIHIVILAEHADASIVNQLKQELGNLWDERMIIFRSGNPLRIEDLQMVNAAHAGVIIIPGENFPFKNPERIDAENLKVLMTLNKNTSDKINKEPPGFVTEIYDTEKLPVLRSAYSGNISIIPTNAFISNLLVQNIIHPGLSKIYMELMNNEGNEIYQVSGENFTGKKFNEIIDSFPRGIPIGLLRSSDTQIFPLLNPDGNIEILAGDMIIVLAENMKNAQPAEGIINSFILPVKREITKKTVKNRKILILRWSNKLPFIMDELESYTGEKFYLDIYTQLTADQMKNILSKRKRTYRRVKARHMEADFNNFSHISKLKLSSYSNIIMLASDRLETPEESDAQTVMGFMILQDLLRDMKKKPEIIVELYDRDNMNLFIDHRCEIIISPLIISYMMSQIALRSTLNVIFSALFSAGGTEIFFRDPGFYDLPEEKLPFSEILYRVAEYGDRAIGMRSYDHEKKEYRTVLNPSKESSWDLAGETRIIVISS
jgi:hypothetical protein